MNISICEIVFYCFLLRRQCERDMFETCFPYAANCFPYAANCFPFCDTYS